MPHLEYEIHGFGIYRLKKNEYASSNDGGQSFSRKRFSTPEEVDLRVSRLWQYDFLRKEAVRVKQLPSWAKELRETAAQLYFYSVNYPSCSAKRSGLGDNYFAIMGDGLLSLLFEIVSPSDPYMFRYHNLHPDNPAGYPSTLGRYAHEVGVRHNDLLTLKALKSLLVNYGKHKNHPPVACFENEVTKRLNRKEIQWPG